MGKKWISKKGNLFLTIFFELKIFLYLVSKISFGGRSGLFEYKSALDIYKKIWRNILLTMDDINGKGLTNIADEVYEEITGEKLNN